MPTIDSHPPLESSQHGSHLEGHQILLFNSETNEHRLRRKIMNSMGTCVRNDFSHSRSVLGIGIDLENFFCSPLIVDQILIAPYAIILSDI